MESARAKYMYSKIQKADGLLFGLSTMDTVCTPRLVISIISPGWTSRTYFAPTLTNEHDSDEITHISGSLSSVDHNIA